MRGEALRKRPVRLYNKPRDGGQLGMPMTAVVLKIDAERVDDCVREACARLDSGQGETVLDFTSVRRIEPKAIRALEELATLADAKGITPGLRGVNVEIYKVLKLVKLAPRFTFLG